MKKLFLEIWNEREHVSQVSGNDLFDIGHWQWHWQFSHILGRGAWPMYKMSKRNIWLMTPTEHEAYEWCNWRETYPPEIVQQIEELQQQLKDEYYINQRP